MKTHSFLLFLVILFLKIPYTFSQFEFSGEFRPRSEYSHGYGSLADTDQKASFFTNQRTRLNFKYQAERFSTSLVLQDVRLWGSQPQLVNNQDFATSVHEAWFQYELMNDFYLKAGRQELSYNDHRIFGNVGWAQQGRSHDLLLLKYESDLKVHMGLAYHENSDRTNNFYFGPDAYKAMQFLWVNMQLDQLDASFLILNNGIPVTEQTNPSGSVIEQGISYSQTLGPVLNFKEDDWGASFSAFFQGGKDGSENTLRAWYGNLEGSLNLNEDVVAFAGYEFLSGTPWDETEVNRSFTPFYGTNHKFNGYMDYFFVGNHINNVGLGDIYLKGKWNLNDISLNGDLHFFHAAAKINPDAGSYLGTELDLSAVWNIEENIKLDWGYSQLFATESMELLKRGDRGEIQNWFWIMITIKPTFFKSGREQQ
ncbi:MAG: hypothetical protein ACP5E3_07390 [Bacteroidales bacterium]